MQTPSGPAFSFFSPVIRAPLSTKCDVGHIKMFSIRQFEETFLTDKYTVKEDKKRTLVSCSNISQCGQRDAKECVKRMRVPQLSEKYLRKILDLVLVREILMYRHSFSFCLLQISLGCELLKKGQERHVFLQRTQSDLNNFTETAEILSSSCLFLLLRQIYS